VSISTSIVIFGASGDLTRRKLIPALFNLFRKGRMLENFQIVGFSGTPYDGDAFRTHLREGVTQLAQYTFSKKEWDAFAPHLFYVSGNINHPEDMDRLSTTLTQMEGGLANRLFYLATPPQSFAPIANELGRTGLVHEDRCGDACPEVGWRRVIIEKPFGTDLATAHALNESLHRSLDETQIYRIDHYLGKETVQNILVFRFGNAIFEPIWNHHYVDSVQITVSETDGVGNRAGYYDTVGILPDMFQNHLLTLLTLVAMEPPASFRAEALHNEKVKVLSSIRPLTRDEMMHATVRGQYRGYDMEPKVAAGSETATFAAVRFFIDNWRWQGVPFYLRSGKCMSEKSSRIIIQFKRPPHLMFPLPDDQKIRSNALIMCLQPDEGIHLRFEAKVPDTQAGMRTVDMGFHYDESFGPMSIPEAYERLLLDALIGDQSLYMRSDSTEKAWELIDPILAAWKTREAPALIRYEQGSWGPVESDLLLARDVRDWLQGCGLH
jgi:glucose-6-phosphate 1-dehydrogenase